MRKLLFFFVLLIIASFLPFHTVPLYALEKPDPLYAHAAILMDADNQRVLFGKEEEKELPMASTTKIMTCLYILEHANLSDIVTFSKKAASAPKVHLGVSTGEQFRLSDLLYSLMLESHNDTAIAVAEHVSGSVEEFCKALTQQARDYGCYHTAFQTPNGLDAPNHYTTCHDLAIITCHALKNKNFLKIIREQSYSIQSLNSHQTYSLHNKDLFLNSYPGAIGVKTGFTSGAGYCFVGAVKKDDRTLVSVVLHSGDYPNRSYKWADTSKLMDYGTENYSIHEVKLNTKRIETLPVKNGLSSYVKLSWPKNVSLLLNNNERIKLVSRLSKEVPAPIKKGTVVGNIQVMINQKLYRSYAIKTAARVEKKTWNWAIKKILLDL